VKVPLLPEPLAGSIAATPGSENKFGLTPTLYVPRFFHPLDPAASIVIKNASRCPPNPGLKLIGSIRIKVSPEIIAVAPEVILHCAFSDEASQAEPKSFRSRNAPVDLAYSTVHVPAVAGEAPKLTFTELIALAPVNRTVNTWE